jgi:hypothetical protein
MKVQSQSREFRSCVALLLMLGLLTGTVLAKTRTNTRPGGKRVWDTKFLDINRWHMPVYNDGRLAIDITRTNFPGGYWPSPVKNYYLFGAGLWVGAISAANETLVTVGYNPNSGAGEFFPTISAKIGEGSGSPKDRVYKYGGSDWPPDRGRFAVSPGDTALVPVEPFSLQDMWMAFTDVQAPQHTSPGKPLGLDVYLTVYAWNYPANQDIFFLIYKVRNATANIPGGPGATALGKVFFGVNCDDDIGDADDDMVGMILNRVFNNGKDTVRNVGFVGDNNNSETPGDKWQGGTPGVCAMKFLESPRGPDGEQLGMTAFKKFTIDIDPVTDPNQYLTMAGIDYRTGVYNAYDSLDEAPGDKRIIQCSGPFNLLADSIATVVVAVIAAPYGREGVPWGSRTENDLLDLVRAAQSAQFIYDRGWLLPGPPEAPNVTLLPADNRVHITWDNRSEVVPAKYFKVASDTTSSGWDPLYRKYDFEGYKIWKSLTGTDWKLLTQCDLIDGDTFRDTTQVDSIATYPRESGIFYNFSDDSVTNGFTYYYAVTAYNHNLSTLHWTPETETLRPPHKVPKDTMQIFLEGGKRAVAVVPRWDPANVKPAQAYVTKIVGDTTNPALACTARVVVPFAVNPSDTFVLRFLGPQRTRSMDSTRFPYRVTSLRNDSAVIDTSYITYNVLDLNSSKTYKTDLPPLAGLTTTLRLKMGSPSRAFDSAVKRNGSYPMDSIRMGTAPQAAKTGFRGSDYRIIWHVQGGTITATVLDLTNKGDGRIVTDTTGGGIPFTRFENRFSQNPDSSPSGYCFVYTTFKRSRDILEPDSAAYLYCCGGYLALNKGSGSSARVVGPLAGQIGDGDTWDLIGYKAGKTAPAYNVYLITGAPEQKIAKPDTSIRLRIRVVPNPYMVTNAWENNVWERKVAFTGLPADATIRIFTLSGDLVRTIEHRETRAPRPGQAPGQPGELGGTEMWDLLNTNQQLIATGVYIYYVKSDVGEQTGKFAVIR